MSGLFLSEQLPKLWPQGNRFLVRLIVDIFLACKIIHTQTPIRPLLAQFISETDSTENTEKNKKKSKIIVTNYTTLTK